MIRQIVAASLTFALACLAGGQLSAQGQVSVYGGFQTAPHARVTGEGGVVDGDSFVVGWEGRSFEAPPYYGLRATWWPTERLGYGIDVNHAKVYAPEDERDAAGYDRLEFTDGLNIVTINAYRRFDPMWGDIRPYIGGGAGVAVPHVDVTKNGVRTFGYQITGPAVTLIAGAQYPLGDRWSLFGEYKGTYSMNEADLDDGSTLSVDIVTNALNVGVSFDF